MLGVKIPALPASLRRTNQRTVISLLLRMGSASRADLAKAAGISQPTAGKITSELLDLGILREADAASGELEAANPRLGRPGHLLQLDNQHSRFLAIEAGIAVTSVAALPVAVKLQDEWPARFATPRSAEGWSRELKKVMRALPMEGLWGVLVSVPGIVDEAGGKVLFSPNLHWLEGADLPGMVSSLCDLPVLLVQEIRALALGQLTAEPDGEDFFLVDFAQGVGGAIVLDGRLFANPMPLSGEFGHSPVAGNRRECGCGAQGCLETLISERGLLESFSLATRQAGLKWPDLVRHVHQHGLESWLKRPLDAAANVIAGALNVMGIHRVIITGILSDLPIEVTNHLAQGIKDGAMWARFGEVICQTAPHRRAAGLVAAGVDRLVLPAGEVASRRSWGSGYGATSPPPKTHFKRSNY